MNTLLEKRERTRASHSPCNKFCLSECFDILEDMDYKCYGYQSFHKNDLWQKRVDRKEKVYFNINLYGFHRVKSESVIHDCYHIFEFDMCYPCFDDQWLNLKIYGINANNFNRKWVEECEKRALFIHDFMVGDGYKLERMLMNFNGSEKINEY